MDMQARADVLALLHQAQRESGFNYLSEDQLREIAARTGMTYSEVYGVATFYSLFSLQPRGRYVIRVCESGPCHLEGAASLLETLQQELNLGVGETTPDGKFTLETVSCLGFCDEAPVMMINEEVYGHLTKEKVREILARY
ncbi:MAG TPA: NADH-quinone oxidoreductase subunit NuoE [Armatimonadetes bacterium]|nr:NADH-quinone oxidoreductase subunit NuoE [Armatimonadota bacterium]